MRTKRYISLLLAALMVFTLTACGANEGKDKDKDGGMTIQPAQLSEEETALTELLAMGMESHRIFDFQVKGAKSVQFNTYELVDGDWSRLQGGGGVELAAESGRIALSFGKIPDGVRLAFQSNGASYSTSFRPEPGDDISVMAFGTSKLDDAAAIELEQEIPLVLQVASSKGELIMYKVDYFGMPRELAKHGYEHVYAITATFSANTVADNSQSAPASVPESADPSPAA